jgi:PEP-CTERM motif
MKISRFFSRGAFRALGAVAAVAACLGGAATSAKADVHYIVSATFDDLTTLSGFFDVNIYNQLTNWDLITTGGTLPGYEYTPASTSLSGCVGNCFSFNLPIYNGGLMLTFANPIGSFGPDPIVGGGPSWENLSFTIGGPPIRYVAVESGVATGVPEPATWAMMLLGFLGVGLAAYRRKSRPILRLA